MVMVVALLLGTASKATHMAGKCTITELQLKNNSKNPQADSCIKICLNMCGCGFNNAQFSSIQCIHSAIHPTTNKIKILFQSMLITLTGNLIPKKQSLLCWLVLTVSLK